MDFIIVSFLFSQVIKRTHGYSNNNSGINIVEIISTQNKYVDTHFMTIISLQYYDY